MFIYLIVHFVIFLILSLYTTFVYFIIDEYPAKVIHILKLSLNSLKGLLPYIIGFFIMVICLNLM